MKKDRVLALIPARAGSKSIPGKNYKDFAGKPLIEHSLDFALGNSEFTEVLVTSNDSRIREIVARHPGANFIQRPESLAKDDSAMAEVIKHSLECMTRLGKVFDFLVLLDPTSPFRKKIWLTEAINMLKINQGLDGVVSISRPHFNPFWVGVSIDAKQRVHRLFSEFGEVARRQDSPQFFRINGSFYCWRFSFAQTLPIDYLRVGNIGAYQIPEETAVSIDTPEEWRVAELIYKIFSENQEEN